MMYCDSGDVIAFIIGAISVIVLSFLLAFVILNKVNELPNGCIIYENNIYCEQIYEEEN